MWSQSSWSTSLEDPSPASFTGWKKKQLGMMFPLSCDKNVFIFQKDSLLFSSAFRFGPLPERVLALYTQQILEGVAYLHRNRVIHRDIKGNNVMLMPTGVIKLIDFGCARRLSCLNSTFSSSVELIKSVHGTPYWMAPEVGLNSFLCFWIFQLPLDSVFFPSSGHQWVRLRQKVRCLERWLHCFWNGHRETPSCTHGQDGSFVLHWR